MDLSNKHSKADLEWEENYNIRFREQLKRCYEDPDLTAAVLCGLEDWMNLAMAVVEKYGEEGEKLVHDVESKYSARAVEYIKETYGTDLNAFFKSNSEAYSWWMPIWDSYLGELPNKLRIRMKCQIGDYWKERIAQGTATRELCWLWCDGDGCLYRTLNPKIKFELTKWMPDGHLYCEHIWELEE